MKKLSILAVLVMLTTVSGCGWPRCFSRGDECNTCDGYSEPIYDGAYPTGYESYPGMIQGDVVVPQNVPVLPGPVETLPSRSQ